MIAEVFFCSDCGRSSRGEIIDHHFKLELRCPFCTTFIRYTQIEECRDFKIYFGPHNGELVSTVAETKKGRSYLESMLDTKQSLRNWQRFVIDRYL